MEHGGLHLTEPSGHLPKHEHDLRHPLIGREAQSHRGRGKGVVLAGGEAVRQGPVIACIVHLVHDLVSAGEIVGPRDNTGEPDGCGQGVPPVEGLEHDIGAVADPGEHIADRLAAHGLLGSGLGDGDAGAHALVGDLQLHDLAGELQHGGIGLRRDAVIRRGLDLPDGIASQGELL